jgi:uncharacterized protein (DUF302 family)
MKTRAMNIQPDTIDTEGEAWGRELPCLVIKQYDNGKVVRKVSVQMRPVDIEDMARKLWDLRQKYENALNNMTRSLKGE